MVAQRRPGVRQAAADPDVLAAWLYDSEADGDDRLSSEILDDLLTASGSGRLGRDGRRQAITAGRGRHGVCGGAAAGAGKPCFLDAAPRRRSAERE